jgi:hypothetical protein
VLIQLLVFDAIKHKVLFVTLPLLDQLGYPTHTDQQKYDSEMHDTSFVFLSSIFSPTILPFLSSLSHSDPPASFPRGRYTDSSTSSSSQTLATPNASKRTSAPLSPTNGPTLLELGYVTPRRQERRIGARSSTRTEHGSQ